MCTVSWLRQEDGYVLYCNRDERRTRKPALGPRAAILNGVCNVAPVDQDQGGSWIGVNEFGLSLCLLNRYQDSPATDINYNSRGWLVRSLLDCKDTETVIEGVQTCDLKCFRPFTLAVLSADKPAARVNWTGHDCLIRADAEAEMPLTSSSFDDSSVNKLRREQLTKLISETGRLDAEALKQFHSAHLPERGPMSVCMHRLDACTVSLSMIRVEHKSIEFLYHPAAPCAVAMTEQVRIGRKGKGEGAKGKGSMCRSL